MGYDIIYSEGGVTSEVLRPKIGGDRSAIIALVCGGKRLIVADTTQLYQSILENTNNSNLASSHKNGLENVFAAFLNKNGRSPSEFSIRA